MALTAALAAVAACGSGAGVPVADRPLIVATTSIWADVVANVACDGLATVETLVPVGADPHGFSPSLADRAQMDDAELVVANGLGLEEGLDDALDAVEAAGTEVFRVAEHVDTIGYSAGTDGDHVDEDAGQAGDDPHVWFDPVRVSGVLADLGARVAAATGLPAPAIDACVATYRDELAGLDAAIADRLAGIPPAARKLVTNHDALGYFADRYGFEVVGTVIPASSGLAGTNPAALEELAAVIDETGVGAIFAEDQQSTDDAAALARRVGDVEVVMLFTGSLGDAASGADTYVGLLSTDAERIATALGQ